METIGRLILAGTVMALDEARHRARVTDVRFSGDTADPARLVPVVEIEIVNE